MKIFISSYKLVLGYHVLWHHS